MVHEAATREEARGELIERWDRERQAEPGNSRIILTHTNDEVRELNEAARGRVREAGALDDEVSVKVERGERSFASGDRVMFLQNERGLGVKNGTLGTIEHVSPQSMTVRTDDGRSVAFDLKDYDRIDHGYAATIHKAQGMTVDRTHVLATPGMDAHGSYVALSRHRDGMELHYGRDDFADHGKLARALSRDRAKDMATDYEPAKDYAERRGISFRERMERVVEIVRQVPEKVRGMFDGLRLSTGSPSDPASGKDDAAGPERAEVQRRADAPERAVAVDPEAIMRRHRTDALVRHARAADAILEVRRERLEPSAEQRRELGASRQAFEEVYPSGWKDAESAYSKDNSLASEAATGRVRRTIQAIQLEAEIRTAPSRADRFVERVAEARPHQPAPVQARRHHGPQGDAARDGRHGEKP